MKPLPSMRNVARLPLPEEPKAPGGGAPTTTSSENRMRLERALKETRQEIASGSLADAAAGQARALLDVVSGPPDPGPEGTLTVRVLGAVESKQVRLGPLQTVSVRLHAGDQKTEQVTDWLGLVRFSLPKKAEHELLLELLGPDGSVVARQKVSSAGRQPPVAVFEIGRTDVMAPAFARAQQWAEAAQAALNRAAELKAQITEALKAQESELARLLADLDTAR